MAAQARALGPSLPKAFCLGTSAPARRSPACSQGRSLWGSGANRQLALNLPPSSVFRPMRPSALAGAFDFTRGLDILQTELPEEQDIVGLAGTDTALQYKLEELARTSRILLGQLLAYVIGLIVISIAQLWLPATSVPVSPVTPLPPLMMLSQIAQNTSFFFSAGLGNAGFTFYNAHKTFKDAMQTARKNKEKAGASRLIL